MYNCESERIDKKAKLKTTSIWTDMLNHQKRYLNSRYAPVEFIMPNSSPYKMRFWEEFFFRFNTSVEKSALGGKAVFYTGSSVNAVSRGSFKNLNNNNGIVDSISCNSSSYSIANASANGNFHLINEKKNVNGYNNANKADDDVDDLDEEKGIKLLEAYKLNQKGDFDKKQGDISSNYIIRNNSKM